MASDTLRGAGEAAALDTSREASEEHERRLALSAVVAALLSVGTAALSVLRASLLEAPLIGVSILSFASVSFAAAALLSRRNRWSSVGRALIPGVALGSTFALALVERGIYCESVYWLPFAPMVTSFVVPELRSSRVAAVTVAGVLALVLAHGFGVLAIEESAAHFALRGGSLVATVLFGGALGYHIERANRRAREMWWYRATHHPLTGLRNRDAFLDTLRFALERAQRGHNCVGLVFLDLDGLKNINDSHGHEAGDALLRESANRLRERIRAGDVPCHLGGDEFTVILEPCADTAVAGEISERIRRGLELPLEWKGRLLKGVSASIGIALFDGSESPEQLLSRADAAMYRAKRAGRNRAEVAC